MRRFRSNVDIQSATFREYERHNRKLIMELRDSIARNGM